LSTLTYCLQHCGQQLAAPVSIFASFCRQRDKKAVSCRGRFGALQREGFVGDLVTYNTLLKACMRARDGCQAEAVHRAMLAAGVKGDEVTYNSLVKALAYAAEDARSAAAAGAAPLLSAAGVAGPGASPWDLQKVRIVGPCGSRLG